MNAVPGVAADNVVVDERIIDDRAAVQGVEIRIDDRDAVALVSERRIAIGRRADVVAVQQVVLRLLVDQDAVLPVARDEIAERWRHEYRRHRAFVAGRIVGGTTGVVADDRTADRVAV